MSHREKIFVTGQPQTFHCRMPLEAVGQDWDGTFKRLVPVNGELVNHYTAFEYVAIPAIANGPIA